VGAAVRSGEQFGTRPDATGIRQTHRTKSICYSSRYCSIVGFAPPPGHCGLAACRCRCTQSPVPEPSPPCRSRRPSCVASAASRCRMLDAHLSPPHARAASPHSEASRAGAIARRPETPPRMTRSREREREGEIRCIGKRLRQGRGKRRIEKERKNKK
jgi:hypothetical protein